MAEASCGRRRLAVVALWGARRGPGQLCSEGGVGACWLHVGRDQNGRREMAVRHGGVVVLSLTVV